MILRLGIALALVLGLAKVASAMGLGEDERRRGVPPGVRLTTVEGRQYEVRRRDGVAVREGEPLPSKDSDIFEIIDRLHPEVFVVFGDSGVLARSGDTTQLESDLRKFPPDLFDEKRAA